MTRQLFTAADIRRLVREQKASVLVMSPDDLITPEAADVARELGVTIVREPGASGAPPAGLRKLPPLRAVRRAEVLLDAFGADIPQTAAVTSRGRLPTTRSTSCSKVSWSSRARASRCAARRAT